MSDDHRRVAVEGVAAVVVTSFEMGETEEQVRRGVLQWMQFTGYVDAAFLLEVAAAIGEQPQPVNWPVEDQERRDQIEQMLGVTSASDQLVALLRARELVTMMAGELSGHE